MNVKLQRNKIRTVIINIRDNIKLYTNSWYFVKHLSNKPTRFKIINHCDRSGKEMF